MTTADLNADLVQCTSDWMHSVSLSKTALALLVEAYQRAVRGHSFLTTMSQPYVDGWSSLQPLHVLNISLDLAFD